MNYECISALACQQKCETPSKHDCNDAFTDGSGELLPTRITTACIVLLRTQRLNAGFTAPALVFTTRRNKYPIIPVHAVAVCRAGVSITSTSTLGMEEPVPARSVARAFGFLL